MTDNLKKKYSDYKKHYLPTPVRNDETIEYVYFLKSGLPVVENSLVNALCDIANTGFFFSYHLKGVEENTGKETYEDYYVTSFEHVCDALYAFPETFVILKEDEEYYSKQELNYLRRVQKYLLFIGLKNYESYDRDLKRYQNKLQYKYGDAYIYNLPINQINDIVEKNQHFLVFTSNHSITGYNKKYKKHELQVLIADEEDNFKLFIEITKEEEKNYKEIKDIYHVDNIKDNDVVILKHFKLLKVF